MKRYVAFLRGINVSGQKLIKMEELKKHFEMPGFRNIVTYIQSGNVLFDSKETDTSKLRLKIERQLTKQLGYEVPTIVRSLDEIASVIKKSPFTDGVGDGKLYVHFLSNEPRKGQQSALDPYKAENEELKIIGREVYLLTDGYGSSKLTNILIEKKLSVTATTRNWATINKVLEL